MAPARLDLGYSERHRRSVQCPHAGSARVSNATFDQDAWLRRIGYHGPREPTLAILRGVLAAHATAIAYETIDPLLGRPPSLNISVLQRKMIAGGRGGYCFEQNTLFRAGLRSLGFAVTSLQARVVRNLAIDAERPALHMVLRVDLPEGAFLTDVGFGNLAPTAPLEMRPMMEQATPHEPMRLLPLGEDLVLQARLGDTWEHIYLVVPLPRVDMEYEIGNWFTATHPDSAFANNLIAARPGPGRTRLTLFNERLTVRHPTGEAERRALQDAGEYRAVLADLFGLALSEAEIGAILDAVDRKGTRGPSHPFFA
jgi:N-hydroxyarylamine O-acetyltransferase